MPPTLQGRSHFQRSTHALFFSLSLSLSLSLPPLCGCAQKAAAKAAAEEDEEWSKGSNVKAARKKEEEEAKLKERAAKRAEADAQLKLEQEEAAKAKLRGAEKVAARQSSKVAQESDALSRAAAPVLSGTGIDAALAVLSLAGSSSSSSAAEGEDEDAAMARSVAADVSKAQRKLAAAEGGLKEDDAHPEKRAKAAFARYKEREMPLLKAEYPSLRMSQHMEMLQRAWKKSDENPLVAHEKLERQKAMAGGGSR